MEKLKLNLNAKTVLEKRYLQKNKEGKAIETPKELFLRVARAIASADRKFDRKADIKKTQNLFFKAMMEAKFMPNSPTLMNAGTPLGQLSACFVLPVNDSIKDIFEAVKLMAIIHKSGGGTGFSFSSLRPKGDIVRTTGGIASGPVSFMRAFDTATAVIKQGGRRRGANMGILRIDHPDIREFIQCKLSNAKFPNFNISVAITDSFLKKLKRKDKYNLINPRNGKIVKKESTVSIFEELCQAACQCGDPGVIFIDEINRFNPTPQLGEIQSTNPCGEQPLLSYESCNLGSINLSRVVKNGQIDWRQLKDLVYLGVHFLDNVIEVNEFPHSEIEKMTKGNRKIGLGVMGFADALILLGVSYNSKLALSIAEEIMKFIQESAREASRQLAKKRGPFPNFKNSIYNERGSPPLRNATVTTIAPTGTISIICGCSSGIEPLFAVSFVRNVLEGTKLIEINPHFERISKEKNFYSKSLIKRIAMTGSLTDIREIPQDVKRLFVTAFDIPYTQHLQIQAAFQKYCDNSVSKTINLSKDIKPKIIKEIYLKAYELKCKGVTVYRYGSKKEQVLSLANFESGTRKKISEAKAEFSGGCPVPYCQF
jgi:ribonucleoside-diphosphate reductase alpha chain